VTLINRRALAAQRSGASKRRRQLTHYQFPTERAASIDHDNDPNGSYNIAKADDMATIARPTQTTESQESKGTGLISNIQI
jgi:hypothetical protein